MRKLCLVAALVFVAATSMAATVSITFEHTEDSRAVPRAEATNFYAGSGVRFPSRPIIVRDGGNQVLQQGDSSVRTRCGALTMEFSPMGVREVRMRVINRHLRSYSVQAFAGSVEVDVDNFHTTPPSGPPFPPLLPFRDIVLSADEGEGDISRVVANPPADCFDLVWIDNLVLQTTGEIVPIEVVPEPNRFSVTAYEVTQGAMSRLTWPASTAPTTPDTRLMALPTRSLRFISGRDTGVRFFINASERREGEFNTSLNVNVVYRDGSRRTKRISENTEGGRATPVALTGTRDIRRSIVRRRARVDESHDYVIPGRFLTNAESMRLSLTSLGTGTPLATVDVTFDGPYRMGLNVARVNGTGMDAVVGPAPTRVVTSLASQFIADLYPISGALVLNESGVLTMNSGAISDCFAFLAALDGAIAGTAAAAPVPDVNYYSNMYIAQNPPGCGGLGWYNTPGALTNTSLTVAAHEVGHNTGINHTTTDHGEAGSGGDNEPWPYFHGSIGAVDEAMGFNEGVFGAVMNLNSASVGVDQIENWGTWRFGPVAPCLSTNPTLLFPNCTATDANITHEFMSYGPTTGVPIWGLERWISDVNYLRLLQWFETCIAIDPPHRFWDGRTSNFLDESGECSAASAASKGIEGSLAAMAVGPQDALVFSGTIDEHDGIGNFKVMRKLAADWSLKNEPGPFTLTLRASDGSIIRSIPFAEHVASGHEGGPLLNGFVVIAPFEPKLATAEITLNQKLIFSDIVSASSPKIALVRPQAGEVWKKGKFRIEWKLDTQDQKTQVYVQYSTDKGATWLPLGLINGSETSLEVDVDDLRPANGALIYVSAARGLNTGFTMSAPFTIGKEKQK